MNKYRITLDASYNYETYIREADNILHLISFLMDAYSITRITKIELLDECIQNQKK